MKTSFSTLLVVLILSRGLSAGENVPPQRPAAFSAPGYQILTTKPYVPHDFDQQVFDELWKTWEEPLRSQAEQATPEERTKMAYARYGFTVAPGDTSLKPQQYVVDEKGNWTITCLACHQGKVAGKVVPGVPNSMLALQTLTEEVRATKLRLGKTLAHMDIGSAVIPLGTSNGTTNAVMFGVALMTFRDMDLNVLPITAPPKFAHHDHDAPAWWNFKKKERLYSDGFAAKGARPLMQFMLVPQNGPETFHEREADFQEVYRWLESLEPPRYPFAIDQSLAKQGEALFNKTCSECHGTYGDQVSYPNKIVAIEEVGTDPARLNALSPENRAGYGASWFAHYGEHKTINDPGGYIAPPLDGIWASAPYFHNGSVPTLWHVFHPSERPKVWQRSEDGYDEQKIGLEVTTFEKLPVGIKSSKERRKYFDTSKHGKSAGGHEFPDLLDEGEKRAVLEYLKTL